MAFAPTPTLPLRRQHRRPLTLRPPVFAAPPGAARPARACAQPPAAADAPTAAEDSSPAAPQESAASTKCEACGREGGPVAACDGTGRIIGGLGAVVKWWPIKAYRPCGELVKAKKTYRRAGQSLDEIAFGRKGLD